MLEVMLGLGGAGLVLALLWWVLQRYEQQTAREVEVQAQELEARLRKMVREMREAEDAFRHQLEELARQKRETEETS